LQSVFSIIDGAIIINDLPTITEVVSGTANGVDKAGEAWAASQLRQEYPVQNFAPTITRFPADWDKYGKAAGHIRNKQMAEYADALLLIWDGDSRGSRNMKETMIALGKPVYEVILYTYNLENKK
jgi:uncharacterized phage-like protein YoqJ